MGVAVVVAPQGEPVSLDEARAHIVDPPAADNGLIQLYIAAARAVFEGYSGRSLMPRTLRLDLDRFPYPNGEIRLPQGPVSGISGIAYKDTDGSSVALDLATVIVDLTTQMPRLVPAVGYWWPYTFRRPGAVSVTYLAGYKSSGEADPDPAADPDLEGAQADASGAAAIPPDIKAAILLMVADLYDTRVSVIDGRFGVADLNTATQAIIERYRIRALA